MRLFFLTAAFAAGLCWYAATGGAQARAGCPPETIKKVGGQDADVYCGPARATWMVQGVAYSVKSGICQREPKGFTIHVGMLMLGNLNRIQKQPLFFLNVGQSFGASTKAPVVSRDGTYGKVVAAIRINGHAWDMNGWTDPTVRVTLTKNRTAGTFTGRSTYSPHVKVTGSFSC